jgi:hypothetical protein
LSGPALVNTLNVVLKASAMPEWQRFLKRRMVLEPTMGSVEYRAKVEDRYQANALTEEIALFIGQRSGVR